ncbi:MAG: dihydropteroate synthase [Desulfitobacteriaceae bacterium]|nr:dihydropteroate synthase [Desulfitobacteriaceae bacterium]MDD4401332.1 dihydropteroate synthase [Desulfitobacteriaceae bacterium]
MRDYGLRWIEFTNEVEAKKALFQIGCSETGINLMAGKALGLGLKLEKVPTWVANILKQEMLAADGDAAVHRDVVVNKIEESEVLLLGTVCQFKYVAQKLAIQPFGLRELGKELEQLLQTLEPPAQRYLDCRGKKLILGERTLVMGILNLTPDSFSDGGKFYKIEDAIHHAERLIAEGADILDIGAESTRPGYREVDAEEEWRRLEPVLSALAGISVPISIDTYKAVIADKALQSGANMINDIWGLQRDPDLARVVGEYDVPVIVMHNQNGSAYHHLISDIITFLKESIRLAESSGLSGDQVIIDPGIGFGKTYEQNLEVLSRLKEFRILGKPVLLGASRKSTIGKVLDLPVEERLEGTIAANVLGVAAGVDIIRVHDVPANRRAIQMADAIVRKQRGLNYAGA